MRVRGSISDVRRLIRGRSPLGARERAVVLPNGLAVHGATRADVRSQHFVSDYFQRGVEFHPGMTVLDVGANIGFFSLEVLRRCHGDVDLIAFEPAPATFAHLERNVRELFPQSPARVYSRALAERQGEQTFYFRPRASVTSSLQTTPLGEPRAFLDAMLREPPAEHRGVLPAWFRRIPRRGARELLRLIARWSHALVIEVPCNVTTVSEVVREHALDRIDFLKVDVEGGELDVLRGIEPRDWARIGRLAVEVHDLDDRVDTIRGMLESAGFEDVLVTQDWPFEGTNVHMVHAGRPANVVAALG
jgi:FkbM family methyltransferase